MTPERLLQIYVEDRDRGFRTIIHNLPKLTAHQLSELRSLLARKVWMSPNDEGYCQAVLQMLAMWELEHHP